MTTQANKLDRGILRSNHVRHAELLAAGHGKDSTTAAPGYLDKGQTWFGLTGGAEEQEAYRFAVEGVKV